MELLLRRLALAFGLACGLLATQAPEFAQQYRQRLAGAVDELARVVATFDAEAAQENLSPDAAVQRLEGNSDTLAQARGRDMVEDRARLNRLRDALSGLESGSSLRRLAGVFEGLDATTARRALGDFQPAVPTTLAGLLTGGLALILGWAGAHLVFRRLRTRAARRRDARAGAV